MQPTSYQDIHPDFRLNGFSLSKNDAYTLGWSYIKEGEDFEKPMGMFLLDWFDQNDFIEMQTSGSTGTPKVIRVSKQAMVNSACATGQFFDLKNGDKVLNCLPMNYVAGKMMFVRSLVLGLEMEMMKPSLQPLEGIKTIYDFAAMVPLQVQNSLGKLHCIKKLIIGGAKVNNALEKKLKALKKTECYETFGMTETVSHIAAKKVGRKWFELMPNVSVAVDERNCLVIQAPLVTIQPIFTNDQAQLLGKNKFKFLGRIDNIINSGGVKLNPEAIEEKLAASILPRFIIGGIPDPDLGEKVVLVIEGEAFAIQEEVFRSLTKFEKPKEIYFVRTFKETPTGKVVRKETMALLK